MTCEDLQLAVKASFFYIPMPDAIWLEAKGVDKGLLAPLSARPD